MSSMTSFPRPHDEVASGDDGAPAPFPAGKTVAVIGGGQLGRMLAMDGMHLGLDFAFLDPTGDECAAAPLARRVVRGGLSDGAAIAALAEGADVLTCEIEHINTAALAELEAKGVNVQPSAASLALIQDKLTQKAHFAAAGVRIPAFAATPDAAAVADAARQFGLPLMLKVRERSDTFRV
jgi:phosphoribosylaminoimidazole carboxylase